MISTRLNNKTFPFLGIVVAAYDQADPLLAQKVMINPTRGWDSDPIGPETKSVLSCTT